MLPSAAHADGYPRPKGATPFRVPWVIAYAQCGPPGPPSNRTHGPPLAYPSCSQPFQMSNYLTVGTADSNALPSLSVGYLQYRVHPGDPATPGDEADVTIDSYIDDVFTKSPLADYGGDVHTHMMLRLTDKENSPSPPEGTLDLEIHFDTPCATTADPQEGSVCAITTSWESLIPGFVDEGKRAIWQIKRVELQDGGADGDGITTSDNTLFAMPGVFVP